MTTEYAIFSDQGDQFGLPAKTFPDRAAADAALAFLEKRRLEMQTESQDAALRIAREGHQLKVAERDALCDTVARWERERPRSYEILAREVGDWGRP